MLLDWPKRSVATDVASFPDSSWSWQCSLRI
jgi:hypothetical protein